MCVGIVWREASKVQPGLKPAESLCGNRKNIAPRAGRLVPFPLSRVWEIAFAGDKVLSVVQGQTEPPPSMLCSLEKLRMHSNH